MRRHALHRRPGDGRDARSSATRDTRAGLRTAGRVVVERFLYGAGRAGAGPQALYIVAASDGEEPEPLTFGPARSRGRVAGFTLAACAGRYAAGHPLTAEVGARILARRQRGRRLRRGGFRLLGRREPVDRPGGGGFMLVYMARDRRARLYGFFVTVPSGPREAERGHDHLRESADADVSRRHRHLRRAGQSRQARVRAPRAARCPGATSSSPRSSSRATASRSRTGRPSCTRSSRRCSPRRRSRASTGGAPVHLKARLGRTIERLARRGAAAVYRGQRAARRALRAGDPAQGPRELTASSAGTQSGSPPPRRVRLEPAALVRRNADRLQARAPPRAPRPFRAAAG